MGTVDLARSVMRPLNRIGTVSTAVLCVVVGTAIGLVLQAWVTTTVPFITLFPAVAAAASLRGFRAGALTTVLAGLTAAYFFVPPEATFDQHDVLPVVVFWIGATVVSGIAGSVQQARARSEARRTELDAVIAAVPDAVLNRRRRRLHPVP